LKKGGKRCRHPQERAGETLYSLKEEKRKRGSLARREEILYVNFNGSKKEKERLCQSKKKRKGGREIP